MNNMNKNELETRLTQVENRMECLREELEFYELEKIQLECCLRDLVAPYERIDMGMKEENFDDYVFEHFEPYFYGKEC